MSEWTAGRIGDLARGVRGVSYRPEHLQSSISHELVVLLRSTNIQNGTIDLSDIQIVPKSIVADNQLLDQGDLAVCMSNGSKALVGKSARCLFKPTFAMTIGAFCSVFHPLPSACPNFVAHSFQSDSFRRNIDVTLAGSAINNLRNGDIEDFPCAIPSVPEQSRIAAVLDTVDEAIAKTEKMIAKLQQVRAGLLHDLLTRGLDEHGQLRDPLAHPEQFKDSPLGSFPKDWDLLPIGAVGEVRLGRQRSPAYEVGAYMTPYLRVANVFDGFIDYSDVLKMNFDPAEQAIYGLQPGDILLNEGQSLELVGRSAIFPGPAGAYCFQNTLVRFRCGTSAIPEFCRAMFKLWLDTRRFMAIAKRTTSVAHLGADRFALMLFPLPGLPEQALIADALNHCSGQIACEEATLQKLNMLKSGLMSDLLTGRVRVPSIILEEKP